MNTQNQISSIIDFQEIITKKLAVLVYFSTQSCNVGEALEPKIRNLINVKFPKIEFYNVDLNFSPEVAANYNAFIEPTILVFFDGKETIRKSRSFGISELEQSIKKYYQLIFE